MKGVDFMGKKSKMQKHKFKSVKLIPVLVIFVVILLTIGYSSLSANLLVGNVTALIKSVRQLFSSNGTKLTSEITSDQSSLQIGIISLLYTDTHPEFEYTHEYVRR